ncbi:MAG: SDR family NAD(P)-dependent oxidoreductase [Nitrospira sp.]|nr:SDR family NAD(P)-dependent oxidoreductase [Nitrospira sp.]
MDGMQSAVDVWVTGASSGIGRAASVELVRRGATVIASAWNESALHQLVNDRGSDATALPAMSPTATPTSGRPPRWSVESEVSDVAFLNAGTCE